MAIRVDDKTLQHHALLKCLIWAAQMHKGHDEILSNSKSYEGESIGDWAYHGNKIPRDRTNVLSPVRNSTGLTPN